MSSGLKIVCATDTPNLTGGAQISQRVLFEYLASFGEGVLVTPLPTPTIDDDYRFARIVTFAWRYKLKRRFMWNILRFIRRLWPAFGYLALLVFYRRDLQAVLRNEKPHLVITNKLFSIPTSLACRQLGIPVVTVLNDLWAKCPNRTGYILKGSLCDRCKGPSRIWCVGSRAIMKARLLWIIDALVEEFQRWLSRYACTFSTVIANGPYLAAEFHRTYGRKIQSMRNSPYLNLAEIRRLPVGVPRERFRLRKLLFVSNLLPTKGLETLLDAMTILDYSLTIVGDGDPAYVSRLKRYVIRKRLSDKVSFAGWIKRQELLKTYHNFSALIVPSLVPEANPGVAYEAIATGTPLVAIARGAFSYPPFSDHGLCILSSSDSKDLAGKLKCLMENYETYHEYWRRSIDYRPQIAREKASFPFLLEAAVKAIQTKGQTDRETLATMQKKLRLQFQE